MGLPKHSVTLTPEAVSELQHQLSEFRHGVNNHLSLIVAAAELLRHRPEMMEQIVQTLIQQPQRISEDMRAFSKEFDRHMGVERPAATPNQQP